MDEKGLTAPSAHFQGRNEKWLNRVELAPRLLVGVRHNGPIILAFETGDKCDLSKTDVWKEKLDLQDDGDSRLAIALIMETRTKGTLAVARLKLILIFAAGLSTLTTTSFIALPIGRLQVSSSVSLKETIYRAHWAFSRFSHLASFSTDQGRGVGDSSFPQSWVRPCMGGQPT